MTPTFGKLKQSIAAIDWLGITRIVVLQVVVLAALGFGVTRYLTWSSDVAQAEYSQAVAKMAFGQVTQQNPARRPCDGGRSI